MAAALLPQLRVRPGSRSVTLTEWLGIGRRHLSHIMTERERLAGDIVRRHTITAGAAGFLRFGSLLLAAPERRPGATSFYETKLLKSTLERLVDFDRINAGEMRLSAAL